MEKILIVEDDKDILTGIADNLKMEGYAVQTASDGKTGLKMARDGRWNLIILDVMLPYVDGFEICRQLRKDENFTPVIILSAKGEEFDKVLGLELGADDYISKPFSPREFLMRVKAVLRRAAKTKEEKVQEVYVFGTLKIDFTRYEVLKNSELVKLTPAEFTVLKLLIRNVGEPVSRHKIMAEIWGEGVTSRAVDTHIWNLREKLEENPARPVHIVTVHRIGYKFVG